MVKLLRAKTIKYLLSVTLGVTLCCGVANAQAKESYTYLKGVERMILGDRSGGEKIFNTIIKSNPSHAPSLYYLSRLEAASNNIENSLDYASRAYNLDSTSTVYGSLYAKLLISTREYDKALPLLETLRKSDPKDSDNYFYTISILGKRGDGDGILEIGREYEKVFGLDEDIVENIYNALLDAKDYYGMLAYLKMAVLREPTNLNYSLMLANLNAALGNDKEAVDIYNRAIEDNPASLRAILALVNYYDIEGNTPEYIKALRPAFQHSDMDVTKKVEIFESRFFVSEPYWSSFNDIRALITALVLTHPSDESVGLLYGRYFTFVGELTSALAQYEMMKEKGYSSSTLYQRLSEMYLYVELYDEAIEMSRIGQEHFGEIVFYSNEIIAHWQKGDYKSATSLVNKSMKIAENDSIRSTLYGLQGDIYHESGENSKAFKAYKKGLKYNPDNALILNNYGYFMGETGKKLDLALEMTTRANELSPDNPTYLDSQAWVLYMMGRYVEAQLLMNRVMTLDKDPSAEVLMHYGDILYALGDDFLARSYWKRALEAGAQAEDIEKRVLQEKATRPSE